MTECNTQNVAFLLFWLPLPKRRDIFLLLSFFFSTSFPLAASAVITWTQVTSIWRHSNVFIFKMSRLCSRCWQMPRLQRQSQRSQNISGDWPKFQKCRFSHSANPNIKHWEGTTNCLNSLSQFLLNLAKNVISQEHFTKAETLVTLKIILWTTSQKQIVIPDAREQFVSVSAVLKFNEYVLGILQSHHNKMVRYNQRQSEYFTVINKQTHQVIPWTAKAGCRLVGNSYVKNKSLL